MHFICLTLDYLLQDHGLEKPSFGFNCDDLQF